MPGPEHDAKSLLAERHTELHVDARELPELTGVLRLRTGEMRYLIVGA